MIGKKVLARPFERLIYRIVRNSQALLRDERNVEAFLAAALQSSHTLSELKDPAGYVEFLRSSFERVVFSIQEIKADSSKTDIAAIRFSTLIDTLKEGAPPIGFRRAERLALTADRLGGLSQPYEEGLWAADVGLHFLVSSVPARKGRLLSNIIRFSRSERCLELGTAYGMSAMFILDAMRASGLSGHLATLEAREPQFSIASEELKSQYGEMVSCHFGYTHDVLPGLVRSLGRLDFLFHDTKDFVSVFETLEKALVPGAVVLFDDIRWVEAPARTYEGWMEVVSHPRVQRAVEIEGMGLLLLR